MVKLRSIKAKFQIYLMLVVLLIIILANLLTQTITNSFVDQIVYDSLVQRGKDLESMLGPSFIYFNYPRLTSLTEEILKEEKDDFITLLKPRGSEIIHRGINFDHTGIALKDEPDVEKIELSGEDYYILTVPITAQNDEYIWGYILYGHSLKDKNRVVKTIRNLFFYFSLLIFVLAIIVLRFIIKKITSPVKVIKKGLEMVTRGNLSFRIAIRTRDEFAFLADKFNDMTKQLESIMTALEASQRGLEKEVRERTKELNTANDRLKEAMEKLKYTQRQIIQTETQKSLTSIVSGFAHEINNPLTGILGYIDLMELNDDLSLYSQKRLERIKDQALRIKDIIGDLNQLDPEIEQTKLEINLSNLLDKLTKILGKAEKSERIIFETDFTFEEIVVYGNHFALWQVFEGIIENAVEAIKERHVENGKIRVVLRANPAQDTAVTEVIDNGGGFDNIEKAFNPFYTTKDRTQKRGIGLSIAFNLIREHKGNIIIRNNEAGALVAVHLPFYQKKLHFEKEEEETRDLYTKTMAEKQDIGG
jgi:signal transduction histidine kinase